MGKAKLEIEKGVPIPKGKYSSVTPKYPILEMQKGDSFFIECKKSEVANIRQKITNCINVHKYKIQGEVRFTIKSVDGGVRTWRVF